MESWAIPLLLIAFAISLIRPHWGVIAFVTLLPLEVVLPGSLASGIPIFRSPIAVAGAAVAAGAAIRLVAAGQLRFDSALGDPVKVMGLLFVAWMFATHPTAAWSGDAGRNWVFTFLQLWILFVIAGVALNTPDKQEQLLLWFGVACLISANVAILRGTIGESREIGARSAGYVLGVNTSARYFTVGMAFLLWLGLRTASVWRRMLAIAGASYLMVGVVFTQSRSGILLALAVVVFLSVMEMRRSTPRTVMTAAMAILIALVLLPSGAVDDVLMWFTPERVNPRDQLQGVQENIRYYLWDAGLVLWRQNPLTGVGIGGFAREAQRYLAVSTPLERLYPHNMYVGLLAETGAIGLFLFLLFASACLARAWRTRTDPRTQLPGPAAIWLVTAGVLVVGGLFKDDAADKVLWLALGMAASYRIRVPVRQVWRRGVVIPRRSPRPVEIQPARFAARRRPVRGQGS